MKKNILKKFNIKGKFTKKKIIITAIAIVLITAVSITIVMKMPNKNINVANYTYTRTTKLVKTSLAESISVTGTVESSSVTNITSDLNYKVSEILVQEGETVEAGQVLCNLDTSELEKQIETKTESLNKSISEAQKTYDSAVSEKASLYSKLTSAQSELNTSASSLQSAKEKYNTAKSSIASAESNYNSALSADKQAGVELNSATSDNIAAAQEKKDITASALKEAEDNLRSAKENVYYDDAEKSYNEALSSYEKADSNYEQVKSNYDKAVESVTSAKERLNEASTSEEIDELKDKLDDCVIIATTSGTITEINAIVGSSASGGSSSALFVIQDIDNLKVSISIDEYDIKKIENNMKAVITSDATGEEEISGFVSQISQTSSSSSQSQGVSTSTSSGFGAEVTIDGIDSGLLIGMNVKVEIVVDETNDVFVVPYDAVGKDENGNSIVYVKNGDEYKEVIVTTGMETDYYIEISSSSLSEGMEVRNSADETSIDAVESEENTNQNGNGMMDLGNMPSGGEMPSGGGSGSMPSGEGNGGMKGGGN